MKLNLLNPMTHNQQQALQTEWENFKNQYTEEAWEYVRKHPDIQPTFFDFMEWLRINKKIQWIK